jgi:hypothetical protein
MVIEPLPFCVTFAPGIDSQLLPSATGPPMVSVL